MSSQPPDRISRMARLLGLLVAARTAARTLRHGGAAPVAMAGNGRPEDVDPSEREVPANPRAEQLVAALLVLAGCGGFGFTAVYVIRPYNTQLLGLALGVAFLLLAGALIVAGKLVVPQETSVEPRDLLLDEGDTEEVIEIIKSGGEGISRRGLLVAAGGIAGAGMVTGLATSVASVGPNLTDIHRTPWQRGVRMVDDRANPYHASDIQIGTFYTALPEHADFEALGASVLVVRLPADYIHLPPARRSWAPEGILAYSKICPHAACAISLYRYPTYAPTSTAQPAFTCPCHYSTFLPGEGGRLIFGPAGRSLPQLPVMIDSQGYLRAAGPFHEDIGPSWWNIHRSES